jgi:hypothetical protein
MIDWLNQVTVLQEFSLDSVDLVSRYTGWRKTRLTGVVTILPDNDVATTEVPEVIGKRADRANDRTRIPALLVLDSLSFDLPLTQQVFQIDRQQTAHFFMSFGLPAHGCNS